MNYEIQQALSRKADDWQLNALRQEVQSLKHEISHLQQQLGYNQSRLSNHSEAIRRLIQMMIESGQFVETNELHEIMQYL